MKRQWPFLKNRRSRSRARGPSARWGVMEQLEPRLLLSTYYVATDGDDGNTGGPADEFATVLKAMQTVAAGDTIIVRDGTYTTSNEIDTYTNGTAADRITLQAENSRQATLKIDATGRVLDISHAYYTIEGLIFDADFVSARDVIVLDEASDHAIIRDCVVMEGARDGIDIGASDVLIEDSVIHDMLWWNVDVRDDAHGIVMSGGIGLTIRNTEIYYVSGDSLQVAYNNWDDVLVEGCTFWNGDLPTARAGFPQGVNPGENAVDTKAIPTESRGYIEIRDSEFYGWDSFYIGTASALNLKQKITALVQRCTLYDNFIDFRLRGATGDNGAHVTIQNSVMYGSVERTVRYEDDIQQMKIYNNTFGPVLNAFFHSPDYPDYEQDNLNNAYWGTVPNEGDDDASNIAVGTSDFVDSDNHDYHLVSTSDAVDNGDDLSGVGVTDDMDKVARPQGDYYDSGAYEWYETGLPTATIVATDAAAAEEGQDTGTFAVSLSEAASGDVTVNYNVSGTADSGDYEETLSGTVTVLDGNTSADITITPVDDEEAEGDETVIITLASGTGYTVGSPSSDTVTIADDDMPSVTITATDAAAAEEGQDTGTFTVSRGTETSGNLAVNYNVSGTTDSGDYEETLSGTVTILDGNTSADITITPVDDEEAEGDETVIITLASGTGYTVGSPSSDTVTIADNDVVIGASDDFESGDGTGGTGWSDNWNLVGGNAIAVTDREDPHGGSYHLKMTKVSSAARTVDLTDGSDVHLTFWWKADSFETGDVAYVEIYDGSWHTVLTINDGDDDNTYHYVDIDLSSYNMISDFEVRFVISADKKQDYFYVDDIDIS